MRRIIITGSGILFLLYVFALAPMAFAESFIDWEVTYNGSGDVTYCYTFTYPKHDPSHFIFETSPDFMSDDISNVKVYLYASGVEQLPTTINECPDLVYPYCYEIKTFTPVPDPGGIYQNMPESIYGVKIEVPDSCPDGVEDCDGKVKVCFDSPREPVCGDYYSRCGNRVQHGEGGEKIKEWNSVWNGGFTVNDSDPVIQDVNDCDSLDHMIVPDTNDVSGGSFTYTGMLTTDGPDLLAGTGNWGPDFTYVALAYLEASPLKGDALIEWGTETEIDCGYFLLLRSDNGGTSAMLPESIISCTGDGSHYEFVDKDVKNRKKASYELQEVDLYGNSTLYGPVSVTRK